MDDNGNQTRRQQQQQTSNDNLASVDSSSSSSSDSLPPASANMSRIRDVSSLNSEYCKQLENWLWNCYWHRAIAVSAYFTAASHNSLVEAGSASTQGETRWQPQGFITNIFGNQLNNHRRTTTSGEPLTLVKIAPIWKRVLAEFVDFLILMIVKLLVTFAIVDNFEVIDFDNIDLSSFQQDGDLRFASLYDLAFTISSELIILEIIHRLIACIVEGYCLSKSGCTPGKSLLNLRVVHAESILPHPGNQPAADVQYALITPARYLTFPRAFFRSAVKNFSLAFFFPLCFTLFHFEFSRTLYDMMGKSLVVENH